MELVYGKILDRDLEHDVPAVLRLGLDAQRELVVDHRHQVSRHLDGQRAYMITLESSYTFFNTTMKIKLDIIQISTFLCSYI